MAPTDRMQLPFRWEFVPEEDLADRSVQWRWKAYTQSGRLALQSAGTFETLSQCKQDAKENGYDEQG